ncbi:purine-binding chemotaxis protein CheW [Loktanella atrilutea]|uniref:Purine-binding chemotaxis protein CheW n=1 Tax=Loktanella atrilutea TaxID=366533 RepID=A0A1M4X080_LOKAT|nr:chemotaxis protein CheW [Loktanella atrilutea]SHE86855.1 purine-binding chemotaxis protein CheW [Loktanella atrilutea]
MTAAEDVTIEDERELVTFRVGDQDFCIDIIHVREIRGWTPATVLPHAPDYVLGVINLRGAIVPIVDLARRLGLPKTDLGDRHVIVIAVVAEQTVGFLVDAVADIIGVAPKLIQPTPDITAQTTRMFIQGVIALEQRMLRLIDISAVLPPLVKEASA